MIREFKSLEEVEALSGFSHANVLVRDQYKSIVGAYHFVAEVACRLQKPNGNPCLTDHKHGWVIESKDGTLAIIGGTCAANNFGVASDLVRDISLATNKLDLQKRQEHLQSLLDERDKKLASALDALKRVLEVRSRVSTLREQLGKSAWRVLEDMARTGNARVRVNGIRRPIFDKDDEVVRPGLSIQVDIGSIKAVSVIKPSALNSVAEVLRASISIFRRANEGLIDASTGKEARKLTAALQEHGRAVSDADALVQQIGDFERNDFTILCFAIKDKTERYKLAKVALQLMGKKVSAEAAKAWLIDQDSALKTRQGVDRLEFGI